MRAELVRELWLDSPINVAGFLSSEVEGGIWVASFEGNLYQISPSLRVEQILALDLSPLNDAFYCPTEKLIVAVGCPGIRIYDLELGEVFKFNIKQDPNLYCAAQLAEGRIVLGGSREELLEMNLATGATKKLCTIGPDLKSISVHPGGKQIIFTQNSGDDYEVVLFDGGTLETRIIATVAMQQVRATFNPRGTALLRRDKHVRSLNFPDLKPLWCFSATEGFIEDVYEADYEASCEWSPFAFLSQGETVIGGSPEGTLYAWNGKSAEVLVRQDGPFQCLAVNEDESLLLTANLNGLVQLWALSET